VWLEDLAGDICMFERSGPGSCRLADIRRQEGTAMSARDKAKDKAEAVEGKIEKAAGELLGDPVLEGKGKAKQAAGNLKLAGEKVKDAGRK
jgi:uncharacterized protein YjbJ (UPF0337 family)